MLITGRLANGDGFRKRELAQKGLEVGGILAGRVEADMEMHIGEALVNVVKEAADVVIACLGLDELGRATDGVEPAIEKRNVMAITSGVKADTDGHDRVESSSRIGHGANSRKKANAGKQAARVLRNPLTWVILVMNGRAVRCNKTSGQGRRDQSSGRGRASGVSRDLHATSTGAPVCHDGAPGKKRTWAGQQENSGCNERSKDRVCARSQNRTRRYESRPLSCAEILN